jgi:hypothetical protein
MTMQRPHFGGSGVERWFELLVGWLEEGWEHSIDMDIPGNREGVAFNN